MKETINYTVLNDQKYKEEIQNTIKIKPIMRKELEIFLMECLEQDT